MSILPEKGKIIILVGLPGLGKSVHAQKISEVTRSFIYSTDSIVDIAAVKLGKTYSEVWADHIKEATKEMDRRFKEALNQGMPIIHDQTNLGVKKRARIISKLPESYRASCIYFRPPETEESWKNYRRFILDGRPGKTIPGVALEGMISRMSPPRYEEGFEGGITNIPYKY